MEDQRIPSPDEEAQQATRVCSNPNCEFGGEPQPLDREHFSPDSRYALGFRTECRRCQSERTKAYNRLHPEKATKNRRNWAQKNKEYVNAYQRNRYQKMAAAYQQQKQEQTA